MRYFYHAVPKTSIDPLGSTILISVARNFHLRLWLIPKFTDGGKFLQPRCICAHPRMKVYYYVVSKKLVNNSRLH